MRRRSAAAAAGLGVLGLLGALACRPPGDRDRGRSGDRDRAAPTASTTTTTPPPATTPPPTTAPADAGLAAVDPRDAARRRNQQLRTAPADYQLTDRPCPIALPTSPDDPDVVRVDVADLDAAPPSRGDPTRGHDVLVIAEARAADRLYGRLYVWDRAARAFACAGEVDVHGADLDAQALRSRVVALVPSSQAPRPDPAAPPPPRVGPRVLDVGVGEAHYCALVEGGRVRCVGDNDSNQAGAGDAMRVSAMTAVPGVAGATALAVGARHSCAIVRGGAVVCWGDNVLGELGGGGPQEHGPVRVAAGAVTQLALGDGHSCALRRDGSVACWGDTAVTQGSFDVDDVASMRAPRPAVVAGLPPAAELCAGAGFTCARLRAGGVHCWGDHLGGVMASLDPAAAAVSLACSPRSDLLCYATADHHAGCIDLWKRGHDVAPMADTVAIASGFDSACALHVDGTVACWGKNDYGQLGDGTTAAHARPAPVPSLRGVKRLAVGAERVAAILADDGLAAWGFGPLGDGRDCSGPPCDGLVPTAIPLPK